MIIKREKKILKVFKVIGNIITWSILTLLVGIIMFLVFVVITTKVSEKKGAKPIFGLYIIVSPSMVPNINVYDVVFVAQTNTKKLKVGDVISFYVPENMVLNKVPVTHRIAEMATTGSEGYVFKTKGDNNRNIDDWIINENDILGKVLFKIPQLGKAQTFLSSKTGWFIVILIPALIIIAYDLFKILKLIILKNKINDTKKEEIRNINNLNINNLNNNNLDNNNLNNNNNNNNNISQSNEQEIRDEINKL